ncbi:hypothetical protein K461DRAFT_290466 [Myriangium duriaei CBS 260.36]|uniref:Uncharacterized protein n=1 Tax=Myriangium duriaei CBS 260.36 TaxID=1168546 RepID=A0A9P4JAU9_9PEZI|nr:hypothetical protein K461DRAFT_290466 [Myriangium duriaei CBS 260.36]
MSTASLLGKRKRRAEAVSKDIGDQAERPESPDRDDVNEIFRRAFEAKFKPLPEQKPKQKSEPEEPLPEAVSDDEDSAWSGVSDDDTAQVEVVQHSAAPITKGESMSKSEKRAFMSSKPPSSRTASSTSTSRSKSAKGGKGNEEEEGTEAANLKNDLALQRLLRESHLLEGNASASDGPTGRNRLKATELRMQSLGAKSSILDQKLMPMSHRKGMLAKAARKESERRQEARENGIILERAKLGKKREVGGGGRRERGIGGPSIGRFRGGTLSLSKKDVQGIQGSSVGSSRRGGKGKAKGRR